MTMSKFDNVPAKIAFNTAFVAVLGAIIDDYPAVQEAACYSGNLDDMNCTPDVMREEWDAAINEAAARLGVMNLSVEDRGELMDFAADRFERIGGYLTDTTE